MNSSLSDNISVYSNKPTNLEEKYTEARNEVGNNEPLTPCPTDGSCRLPNCFCSQSGTTPPGNFDRKSTPQMIVLTFDGPVTDRIINIYKSLFSGKLRNPNMCPIKGTFYLSHQWNNYDQSQWLASRGNEIGVNSITHEILSNKTRERWRHEMVGMRESLQEFSYVERAVISGMRAPHFMIGGDEQFAMMAENDFSYDNSMPTKEGPFWPQTLDHNISWDCGSQKCPTRPYKGIWEIPTQLIQSNDGIWYPTVAKALRPYDSKTSVRQLLARNFMRNYKTNRAPLVLSLDSEFLTYLPDNGAVLALEEWLADVLSKRDVYVVTASQVISWMKSPIAVNAIEHFRPWQCNFRMNDHIQPCETPSVCSYSGSSGGRLAHSFRVCGSCPKNYPWIEDPLGKRQL